MCGDEWWWCGGDGDDLGGKEEPAPTSLSLCTSCSVLQEGAHDTVRISCRLAGSRQEAIQPLSDGRRSGQEGHLLFPTDLHNGLGGA